MAADSPRITVVIASPQSHGVAAARDRTAFCGQDEPRFELIVVDEASTDGSHDYLRTLSDPRVSFIGPERLAAINKRGKLGISTARNVGMQAATAALIAFLDSDDVYRPGRLSAAIAAFDDDGVVCAISAAARQVRDEVRASAMADLTLASTAFEWAVIADLFPVEATGLTVRRADALAIDGFRPELSLSEDREFVLRLARRGTLRMLPQVLWQKYWSADGLSMDWDAYGRGLLAYLNAQPQYRDHFPKVASYMVTKTLIADIRNGLWSALRRDLRAFTQAGLLSVGPAALIRNHREVRRYRRKMSNPQSLAFLSGPPPELTISGDN